MMTKRLLCPERLRRVPPRFSWIDQRLVRDRHIARLKSHGAHALYLFLITVADADGLSYYSDPVVAKLLRMEHADLVAARRDLKAADLIAYEKPLYQVLSLEYAPPAQAAPCSAPLPEVRSPDPSGKRTGECRSLSEIVREMLQSGGRKS